MLLLSTRSDTFERGEPIDFPLYLLIPNQTIWLIVREETFYVFSENLYRCAQIVFSFKQNTMWLIDNYVILSLSMDQY